MDSSDTEKITPLYQSRLSRPPNAVELGLAQRPWTDRKGNTKEALRDALWVLLDSGEFLIIH